MAFGYIDICASFILASGRVVIPAKALIFIHKSIYAVFSGIIFWASQMCSRVRFMEMAVIPAFCKTSTKVLYKDQRLRGHDGVASVSIRIIGHHAG